jgi:hypothetical protein
VDKGRHVGGKDSGPRPRQPEAEYRWSKTIGVEVHMDTVGGFSPAAYGNVSTAVVVVDTGHYPPFGMIVPGQPGPSRKKLDTSSVPSAIKRVV